MKKLITVIIIAVLVIGGVNVYYNISNNNTPPVFLKENTYNNKKYIIIKAGNVATSVDTLEEAKVEAAKLDRAIAVNTMTNEWVYSDFNPFLIITEGIVHDFENFKDAIYYAKTNKKDKVYFKNSNNIVWDKDYINKYKELYELDSTDINKLVLDVKLINQYPELPRGCEVTSLAMLLDYSGQNIDKMTLAKEIKKDSTEYKIGEEGRVYYGNPYDGFVGDMYNLSKNGYGVYHGPIVELAKKYVGERVVDLTGSSFEDIVYLLTKGYPVLVITNAEYRALEDQYFDIWHTPTGIVKTTSKLHSVVMTGIDSSSIYINDPLSSIENRKVDIKKFRSAWEQMGNQAIVILD